MSFILDALKKSESDRQRQTGPALFEVKVAPPRSGFPVWAIAIVVLLVINMGIVGWMLVRRMSRDENTGARAATVAAAAPTAAQSQATTQISSAPAPTPMAQTQSPPVPFQQTNSAPPEATLSQPTSQAAYPAPPNAPGAYPTTSNGPASASSYPPAGNAASPYSPQNASAPYPPSANASSPYPAPVARQPASEPGSVTPEPALEQSANPDDYAPATEGGTSSPFKGHVKRGTESGLPLYQDAALAQGSNLPQLRLDLHVYAARPQDRFALINMHKMHEGDSLAEGIRIETITPDGVILSRNGAKFLLPRE